MAKVLIIDELLEPDHLANSISNMYLDWETRRDVKVQEWEEVHRYVYATDTTKTSNSKLPWSNKTTIPKLCQIRDNLFANYMASLFPKRKWLIWQGNTRVDDDIAKKQSIEAYMSWAMDRNEYYDEVAKCVADYIDYGNAFITVEWLDQRNEIVPERDSQAVQVGYVGPMIRRISPLDIVFNPIAPNFLSSPKIIRSWVSIGEVKEILERNSNTPEESIEAQELFNYLVEYRTHVGDYTGTCETRDAIFSISGFDSFKDYLQGQYAEVLTFYGDIYDYESNTFLKNQVIKIVDRHKVLTKKTNPSYFGHAPIYHAGWRIRPDNLWAMGPLDNLVGMQYRIDHLENMKADIFDLTAYPPMKITGYVEDFTWGPFEKILVGDDGNVELISPNVQALQADNQIAILEQKMEEMSGSPKEAMGFRSPGEKTKYEVQRLENSSSRIYQNKIGQFERQVVEPSANAMLEESKRRLTTETIRIFDTEFKINKFKELSAQDITGNGRLKPVAARHFAEQAQMVQNLTNFFNSAIGQDPEIKQHFSAIQIANMFENLLDLEDQNIVEPYIRITEQADAQRLLQTQQEQVAIEQETASGIGRDYDLLEGA